MSEGYIFDGGSESDVVDQEDHTKDHEEYRYPSRSQVNKATDNELKPTLDFTTISDDTDALLKIGEHAKDDAFLVTTKEAHDLLCRQQPRE
ncbi:hypothetical protein OC835_006168 [Tilletia horrida]|nr:hypothetical protein OC835_006168 [Tilletia horrida]